MSGHVEQNPIAAQLQRANDTLHASLATQSAAEEQKRLAQEQVRAIQEQIKGGETTGDRLQDLLIVRYGLDASKYEDRYETVQKQVWQHQGELVLVVARREDFNGCVGFGYRPSPRDYSLETTIALGALERSELVIDPAGKPTAPYSLTYYVGFGGGTCDFPTGQYAYATRTWPAVIHAGEGNLPADLTLLNEPLRIRNSLHAGLDGNGPKQLEIFVGNQSTIEWFAQREVRPWEKVVDAKPTPLLERMAAAINRPINGQTGFRV